MPWLIAIHAYHVFDILAWLLRRLLAASVGLLLYVLYNYYICVWTVLIIEDLFNDVKQSSWKLFNYKCTGPTKG